MTLFTLVLATSWLPSARSASLQPDSLLAYLPSLPGNTIITAFYGLLTVALFFHTARSRSSWALCLPIGTFFSCLGYGLRLLQREDAQQSKRSIYIPTYLFIVLSPACFLAFNYIVFGRFVVAVTAMGGGGSGGPSAGHTTSTRPISPDEQKEELGAPVDEEKRLGSHDQSPIGDEDAETPSQGGGCCGRRKNKASKGKKKAPLTEKSPFSLLPPRLYTAVFVISDVVTFLIQVRPCMLVAATTKQRQPS